MDENKPIKDYTLGEIKEICEKTITKCKDCIFADFCWKNFDNSPIAWYDI